MTVVLLKQKTTKKREKLTMGVQQRAIETGPEECKCSS